MSNSPDKQGKSPVPERDERGLASGFEPQGDLARMLDALEAPVYLKDESHRWVYLNNAACTVLGSSREEMLGKNDKDVYPDDYADFLWAKDDHVLKTGESISYESMAPWRGQGFYVVTRKSLYVGSDGKRYVVGVIQDIHDLRSTDAALKDSETKLRTILDSAQVGVMVIRDSHVVFANPYVIRMGGYSSQEIAEKNVLDFIHPKDKALVSKYHERRIRGESVPEHYLVRVQTKDGKLLWVSITGVLIEWEGRRASLNFVADLSEMKAAQDALARSERKLRQVLDLVPHMIYARDNQGRYLMLNKTMARAIGGTVDELTGAGEDTLTRLCPGTAVLRRFDEEVFATGASADQPQLEFTDFAGRSRTLRCTAMPFKGTGEEDAVLGVCTDVTRSNRVMDRLERLNKTLLAFGSEPEENIQQLVRCCGELLAGACALYSRISGETIETAGVWREPEGFKRVDSAQGHACADVSRKKDGECVVIRNLMNSPYAETDPNVLKYSLRTYMGVPVWRGNDSSGTLCVVYQEEMAPQREDEWLLSLVGAAIAVEERRNLTLKSLREREAALRAMFDATPDRMVLCDARGVVITANKRAAKSFGLSVEELAGQRVLDLLSSTRGALFSGVFEQVRESGEVAVFSEQTGGRFFDHRISPILEADGTPSGFVCSSRDTTEEKNAQREIMESEDRFRATFEQSAVGIAHIGMDGRYQMVNDKLCDILGYTRDELLRMRFQDVTDKDDLKENLLLHKRMVSGDLPFFSMEKRYRRKNGTSVWVNVTVSAIMGTEGRYRYNCTVVEDISLRKQIENALLRRDAVLEAVGYAAERFLLVTDWQECINEVLETFGTAADASRAYMFRNVVGGDGRLCMSQVYEWTGPGVPSELGNAQLKALPYDEAGLYSLRSTLGEKRPFYGRVSELTEADRSILEPQGIKSLAVVPIFVQEQWWGFVGFDDCETEREWLPAELEALMAAADILGNAMARKRIEVALRESERKFRIIAETISDVFWISVPDRSKLLYLSPAFERYIGSRASIIEDGRSFYDHVHEEDRVRLKEHYRSAPAEAGEIEYRVYGRDGRLVWVRERSFPVIGADGEVEWLAGVSMDITENRNARERIRSSLREKELLLQEVHHRVKNNLQIISSLLDMAGRRIVDPKAREIMRDTQSKIHSMAMIHLQLYGYERFDSIDIASYAKLLAWQLGQMYNATNVNHDFELEETFLPLSKAIPCGLVLSEALSNAYKHAFTRGRKGTLRVCVESGEDGYVTLCVSDDGVGMPKGFDESASSSVGLKLLGNIARFQLGGSLEIESQEGTTVTIRFNKNDDGDTA